MGNLSQQRVCFILIVLFCTSRLTAQKTALPFLLNSVDARNSAMGYAGVASTSSVNVGNWNPGSLAYVTNPQAAASFGQWQPHFDSDYFFAHGSYGQYVSALKGTLVGTVIYHDLGDFNSTNEEGQALATFKAHEYSIGISYARMVADDLSVGAQLKFLQSSSVPATSGEWRAHSVNTAALDVGVLWRPRALTSQGEGTATSCSFGASLSNLGPAVNNGIETDPLPTIFRVGASIDARLHKLFSIACMADVSKILVARNGPEFDPLPASLISGWNQGGLDLSAGIELVGFEMVACRVGVLSEASTNNGRTYLTTGLGLQLGPGKIDVSIPILISSEPYPVSSTMFVSAAFAF
jgi:hypothetical protein